MVIAVVIVVTIVAPIRTMVVDMDVEVESALSVTSLGILQGSVLMKGAGEVRMGGGMTGMELVVVGTMILIKMVIDLEGALGIVVLEEDQELLL
ncbi:hypothetical protein EUGRSUZ_C00266 [Eucalyptus grandis]|uniref:Uncharacterized protein n=2 Tax=Eucalyptus grandis TaxID=71139 RepID=A0ACC3LBZ2_EUCGR|nr:hypothetical protein EUGRSUZ_C00266 [Eucalyptus grandis]